MKFKSGMVVGFGIGYVLGARAGRERYHQIKRVAGEVRKHPAVAQITDQATGVIDLVRTAVAGGLSAGSRGLRSVADTNRSA